MKMYLLFDWTEEREAKMHIGIYSTVEKAKAAAELDYKSNDDFHDDLPEGEFYELEWKDEVGYGGPAVSTGFKHGSYHVDYPYEIEGYEVDVFTQFQWGPGTDNPTKTVHPL